MRAICGLMGLFLVGGCGGDSGGSTIDASPGGDGQTLTDAAPNIDAAISDCTIASGTALRAAPVVTTGLIAPTLLTHPPGDPRLFVVEQTGVIRIIENDVMLETPFLDIGQNGLDRVRFGGERGLLGLAFAPDYASSGRFFVHYSSNGPSPGGDHLAHIAEYSVSSNPNVANTPETIILALEQDFANHNGGMVEFGPDGFLYAGFGDGGSADDPNNRGQTPTTLLGSMIRIDVGSEFANQTPPYGIPSTNPFADGNGGAPEVWTYGWRNPWRWSFDRMTGDIWAGDVGQGCIEEINVSPSGIGGLNFGWNVMEGTECNPEDDGDCNFPVDCETNGLTMPRHQYRRIGTAGSITGGYVYRGACMPDIGGWYLFADYELGEVYAIDTEQTDAPQMTLPFPGIGPVTSFGQDVFGELYIVTATEQGGRVFRVVADGS